MCLYHLQQNVQMLMHKEIPVQHIYIQQPTIDSHKRNKCRWRWLSMLTELITMKENKIFYRGLLRPSRSKSIGWHRPSSFIKLEFWKCETNAVVPWIRAYAREATFSLLNLSHFLPSKAWKHYIPELHKSWILILEALFIVQS